MGGDVRPVTAEFGTGQADNGLDINIFLAAVELGNFAIRGALAAGIGATGRTDDVDNGGIGASKFVLINISVDIADEVVVWVAGQTAKGGSFIVGEVIVVVERWKCGGIGFVNIQAGETGSVLGTATGDGVADIDVIRAVVIAVVAEATAGIELDVIFAVEIGVGAGTTSGGCNPIQTEFVADAKKHGVAVGKGTGFATDNRFFDGGTANGGFQSEDRVVEIGFVTADGKAFVVLGVAGRTTGTTESAVRVGTDTPAFRFGGEGVLGVQKQETESKKQK